MTRRAILTTIASTVAIGATIGLMAQSGEPAKPKADPNAGMLANLNPNDIDTVHFKTNLGSFRLINGKGRIEIDFTGTVLISQLQGVHSVTGNVQKEFPRNAEEAKHGKELWFGSGKLVVDGSFRAVQWFGKNMSGKWQGAGMFRLYGDFDKDLNTGSYWYESDKTVRYWSPYGPDAYLPPPPTAGGQTPTIKRGSGG